MGYDLNLYKEETTGYFDDRLFSIGGINGTLISNVFECSWFPLTVINKMKIEESEEYIVNAKDKLELLKEDKQYVSVKKYLDYMLKIIEEESGNNMKWNIT